MAGYPSNDLITDFYDLLALGGTRYLALYTTNPTAANTGTEVTGGSYARQQITWGTVSAGTLTNTTDLTFAGMPSATVTHWAIFDAATAGNFIAFGPLSSSAVLVAGDTFTVQSGDIDLTFAGS